MPLASRRRPECEAELKETLGRLKIAELRETPPRHLSASVPQNTVLEERFRKLEQAVPTSFAAS
ncbi:MAG: hypothetical protein U0736_27560 [Gemmataceae bacterium]